MLHARKEKKVIVPPPPTASQKLFAGKKIRIVSYFTNTIFTMTTPLNCTIGLEQLVEYSLSKIHNDLEGIVSEVVYFDSNLEFAALLKEQQNANYDFTLVASKYTVYMTMNPTGERIWSN